MQTHNNQPSRTYQLPRRRSCNAIDIATTINTTICQQYAVFESTAGGSTFVSHVQYIISCNGGMVLTATKQASNRTYNNQPLSVLLGDRSAYWGGGINVSAMHSITSQLHDNTIHTPPPYESLLIKTQQPHSKSYVLDDSVINRYQTNKVI